MEVDRDQTSKNCFKIQCNIMGNLRISCDAKTSIIVLWSKYLILVYENLNFNNYAKKIEPQFEIEEVIVLKNCLICLDCSGNVNIDTFESLIIWKQNIKCICTCEIMDMQYVVSLQFEQNKAILLVNNFNMSDCLYENDGLEFMMPNEDWMTPGEDVIMVCSYIKLEYSRRVKNMFNIGEPDSNDLLVIVSFDKRNVYAILFTRINVHNKSDLDPSGIWVKLHKSNTDIKDIKVSKLNDISILIGLAGGNIIRIPLLLKNRKPEVYHLNTAINKFVMRGNSVVYTDTLTMWKCENIFDTSDTVFEQLIVRNVRDFCLITNHLICVSFSNLIYSFNMNHRSCYVAQPDTDYSCSINLITNSDYFQEIMDIIDKTKELSKKEEKERGYLMALALSKRGGIRDLLIRVTSSIYDDYRELAMKYPDLTLTDDLNAYHRSDSYYFLINIVVITIDHKINYLLSDVLCDTKIHITLLAHGILKTTSLMINGQLTAKNLVIALNRKNLNIKRMQVQVKIITNVPGKYDESQRLWATLYEKIIYLNAENFINMKTVTTHTYLKEDEPSLDMLIYKRVKHIHGTDYKFNIPNCQGHDWTFFVKLPQSISSIEDILKLITLDSNKTYASLKDLAKISKNKTCLEIDIGKEVVKLNIESGNLKVACTDVIIASDIRNFFSNIIFTTFKGEPGKELIDHKYYTTIENLKRDINACINERISTDEFALLLTRFLRNVYCLIPI